MSMSALEALEKLLSVPEKMEGLHKINASPLQAKKLFDLLKAVRHLLERDEHVNRVSDQLTNAVRTCMKLLDK